MIALLLAACLPLPTCSPVFQTACATPTPTIQGEHVRVNTAFYRVRARIVGSATWSWSADVPYEPATASRDELAPVILLPWPVQRIIPHWIEKEDVEVMVMAVSPTGLESPASNVVTMCMPPVWQPGEAYQ